MRSYTLPPTYMYGLAIYLLDETTYYCKHTHIYTFAYIHTPSLVLPKALEDTQDEDPNFSFKGKSEYTSTDFFFYQEEEAEIEEGQEGQEVAKGAGGEEPERGNGQRGGRFTSGCLIFWIHLYCASFPLPAHVCNRQLC